MDPLGLPWSHWVAADRLIVGVLGVGERDANSWATAASSAFGSDWSTSVRAIQ